MSCNCAMWICTHSVLRAWTCASSRVANRYNHRQSQVTHPVRAQGRFPIDVGTIQEMTRCAPKGQALASVMLGLIGLPCHLLQGSCWMYVSTAHDLECMTGTDELVSQHTQLQTSQQGVPSCHLLSSTAMMVWSLQDGLVPQTKP